MSVPSIYNQRYEQIIKYTMPVTLVTICICGVLGNTIVLSIGLIRKRYQNNVTNCFIMNLAVTDLLFLLISVPLTAYLGTKSGWIISNFICKIHMYLAHVFLQATCYTLASMSIDRYLYMVHGLWYRKFRKAKYAQIACLLIWIVSAVFMFPYEHFLNTNANNNNNNSQVSNNVSDCLADDSSESFPSCIYAFGFYYVLPLSIICLCYIRVLIHVRRNGYEMVKRLSGLPRQSIKLRRRRVQFILLALTLAFALCWLPIHILEILKCSQLLSSSFYYEHFYAFNIARMIAHALSYFNSCLNPFLYALLNESYFSKSLS